MRIALGADHAGVALKARIRGALDAAARGGNGAPAHTYVDFGAHADAPVDYPDFARPVAEGVAAGAFDRGVLVCGTGVGMAIAANKVPGVRAALVHDAAGARLCREHNDANVLTLAGRALPPDDAPAIVAAFLDTPFGGGRHAPRVAKITALEQRPDPGLAPDLDPNMGATPPPRSGPSQTSHRGPDPATHSGPGHTPRRGSDPAPRPDQRQHPAPPDDPAQAHRPEEPA